MDNDNEMIVDFVLQPESEVTVEHFAPVAAGHRLGRCTACGAEQYSLASRLGSDKAKGIPSSKMYECIACGTYRLG